MPLSRSRATPPWAATLPLALITALLLLLPATSRAAVPITQVFAGPVTPSSYCVADGSFSTPALDAGGRNDFCVAFALDSPPPAGDDLQRMVVDTPLGFAGDTTGRPTCTARSSISRARTT